MNNTKTQIDTIKKLFQETQKQEIPIWLESGWAIDARLGRITREHADIDIAFAAEKRSSYTKILIDLGFKDYKKMDYGFLMSQGEIVIDSEPCYFKNGSYTLDGFPPGSFPEEKEGKIDDFQLRCMSWGAIYFEFLGYGKELAKNYWRPKDHISLKIVEEQLNPEQIKHLKMHFLSNTD